MSAERGRARAWLDAIARRRAAEDVVVGFETEEGTTGSGFRAELLGGPLDGLRVVLDSPGRVFVTGWTEPLSGRPVHLRYLRVNDPEATVGRYRYVERVSCDCPEPHS